MPITFDELVKLGTIVLFDDYDFKTIAYIHKRNELSKSYSIDYIVYASLGLLKILAVWVCTTLSAIANMSSLPVTGAFSAIITTMILIRDYDKYPVAISELHAIPAMYSIELYELHNDKCIMKTIYISEDGSYDIKYKDIIDKIFSVAESIYCIHDKYESSDDILLED